jgi:hypothetical protein
MIALAFYLEALSRIPYNLGELKENRSLCKLRRQRSGWNLQSGEMERRELRRAPEIFIDPSRLWLNTTLFTHGVRFHKTEQRTTSREL